MTFPIFLPDGQTIDGDSSEDCQMAYNQMINKQPLQARITQLSHDEDKPELEIISTLQSAAALVEDGELLDQLCKLKSAIVNKMFNI